jgi:hypothetical protein
MSTLASPPSPFNNSPTPDPQPSPAKPSMLSWVKRLPDSLKMAMYRLATGQGNSLDLIRVDPAQVMVLTGLTPDPWQRELLECRDRWMLLLCSRQVGKTATAAAMCLATALSEPDQLNLILSPSEKQSKEIFRTVLRYYNTLKRPIACLKETQTELELANGSRVIAFPENERTVRVYSAVSLLVIDEAARVDDNLYEAVKPMQATVKGRLIALSTPFGMRGWFYRAWRNKEQLPGERLDWKRVEIRHHQCKRLSRDFIARERREKGPRWFRQEYECSFEANIGGYFDHESVQRALTPGLEPLRLF